MDVELAIFNTCSEQPSYSWPRVCHRTLELNLKTNSPREAIRRLLSQANKIQEWESRGASFTFKWDSSWGRQFISLLCLLLEEEVEE